MRQLAQWSEKSLHNVAEEINMIQLNIGKRFMSLLFDFIELVILGLGKKYAFIYTLFIFAFHPTLCITEVS